jgi:hypothetical protein
MTDDMHDRFDELLRDATRAYNRPPDEREMPLDDMWGSIEAQSFPRTRRVTRYAQWLRIAAALVIGVGIGRLSFVIGQRSAPPRFTKSPAAPAVPREQPLATADSPQQPADPATSRYLGQAAALLIALPSESGAGRLDEPFIERANELLLTTRLLLDSQSGSDPSMRNLLEDLELVLVQVVRLQKEREPSRRTELELIQQALDQRDVIPRLRSAASEYAADD